MKLLSIASLALVLALSGCAPGNNEIGEIEKRNRFDACVLDFMADETNSSVSSWKFDYDKFRQAAEISCRELLK